MKRENYEREREKEFQRTSLIISVIVVTVIAIITTAIIALISALSL